MLETTLGQLFDKAVHQYKDKTAVIDLKRSVTYRQLGEEVNRLANALLKLGITPHDRVSLWMENSIEYIVAEFAIAKIGAVRVPLNTFLSNHEVVYRIDDSEAKMIICDESLLPRIDDILKETKNNPLVIANGGGNQLDFQQVIAEASLDVQLFEEIQNEDLAAIMYTGGTTGRSKGVMHTHKSIISIAYSEIVELEIERGVIMLHVAPLPHAAGFMVLPGLLRGGKHILQTRFNPQVFCETVEREKVSYVFMVPTMIYNLLEMPGIERYNYSSLRTIVYGAAPMAPSKIKQAITIFGPVLMQVYSQMEVANQTSVLTKEEHVAALRDNEERLASCGRSIIMSQVKIVDDAGIECPSGKIGEIVTKGPHLMKGYWRLEAETEETLRNGWLFTGDMAYQDESGYIFLVDRKKDIIISGGFNVYTTVVEKVLFEYPKVRQATVIGVPDHKWGEAVKAFVVAEYGTDEMELINYCRTKLAKYEVPKSIEFVDSLPLTPYGKVDKKALRQPYWGEKERQIN